MAQIVKNLLAMQNTWVRCLGREDPLEKEVATHSSILVWEIPLTEEHGWLLFLELELDTTEQLTDTHIQSSCRRDIACKS